MSHEAFLDMNNIGKWAIITGGSRGIGLAYGKFLAKQGFNLIIVSNDIDDLEASYKELTSISPVTIITMHGDLGDKTFVEKVSESVLSHDVGVLINCAAFGFIDHFVKGDLDFYMSMLSANINAPVHLSHVCLRKWLKSGAKGVLINVASANTDLNEGVPYSAVYSSSKSFIKAFTQSLHFELKEFGIHVINVGPGPTDTGFQKKAGTRKLGFMEPPEHVVYQTFKNLGKKSSIATNRVTRLIILFHNMIPFEAWRGKFRAHFFGKLLGNVKSLNVSYLL